MKRAAICLTFIAALIVGVAPAARADVVPVRVPPIPRVIVCYPRGILTIAPTVRPWLRALTERRLLRLR